MEARTDAGKWEARAVLSFPAEMLLWPLWARVESPGEEEVKNKAQELQLWDRQETGA